LTFEHLRSVTDALLPRGDGRKGGRPPYPSEVIPRILVVKYLNGLSDEQMEFQLLDRMSDRRFCLLADSANVPDRNTLWHWQQRLGTDRKFNRMSTSMPRGWGITSLRTWVYLGACSGPVARDFSVCAFLGSTRRSPAPQRWPNRCCLPSPTDALIDLKVRHRLGRFVPIWLNLDTLAHGRVAPVPQRWPACWCDARWLCLHPDVLQYLPDVSAVGDEGDDAHLPATDGAQQRGHNKGNTS
jgi:hypothetical protein